ncbi:hypothetical protein BH10PSE18_BH10PSE18_27980 [soil metagenome]|jgi:hypothetical protein
MQPQGTQSQPSSLSPVARAQRVVALTAAAWRIPPASAREIARRMPSGYVPLRVRRRLRLVATPSFSLPLLAHSW